MYAPGLLDQDRPFHPPGFAMVEQAAPEGVLPASTARPGGRGRCQRPRKSLLAPPRGVPEALGEQALVLVRAPRPDGAFDPRALLVLLAVRELEVVAVGVEEVERAVAAGPPGDGPTVEDAHLLE